MLELNKIYCGDCLELMPNIESESIDMILADVPYGTTACKWDSIIPLEPMWEQLKRIIKPNGAIVMTASQPFTTKLIASNMGMFKYEWIWNKTFGKEPFASGKRPQKAHENICLFYYRQPVFNSQKTKGTPYIDIRKRAIQPGTHYQKKNVIIKNSGYRYPISVINFVNANFEGMHPTQKPVALIEYLIKTYTNENETVLDFTIGSGTTPVACIKTSRQYIGMEISPEYCEIAEKRIFYERQQLKLF